MIQAPNRLRLQHERWQREAKVVHIDGLCLLYTDKRVPSLLRDCVLQSSSLASSYVFAAEVASAVPNSAPPAPEAIDDAGKLIHYHSI